MTEHPQPRARAWDSIDFAAVLLPLPGSPRKMTMVVSGGGGGDGGGGADGDGGSNASSPAQKIASNMSFGSMVRTDSSGKQSKQSYGSEYGCTHGCLSREKTTRAKLQREEESRLSSFLSLLVQNDFLFYRKFQG